MDENPYSFDMLRICNSILKYLYWCKSLDDKIPHVIMLGILYKYPRKFEFEDKDILRDQLLYSLGKDMGTYVYLDTIKSIGKKFEALKLWPFDFVLLINKFRECRAKCGSDKYREYIGYAIQFAHGCTHIIDVNY